MAKFEPTEEEKAAASYLDWDDAELGKFCKYVALMLEAKQRDSDGLHRVGAASCAMMLIGQCVESNAGTMTLNLGGHTHKGIETGDWVLTIKRKSKPRTRKKDTPQ